VQEIRFESRFLELHHQIWESLREEVERAYARTAPPAPDNLAATHIPPAPDSPPAPDKGDQS
jgi:hypothetical protein